MNSDQDTACAVGCPIRRSRDQRSLASPPGFSQRATSFIASQCQGIHQMPFLRASRATPNGKDHQVQQSSQRQRPSSAAILSVQKTLRDGTHRPETPPLGATPAAASVAVTQLASSHLSINEAPRRSRTGRRGQFCHLPRFSMLPPRRAFRRNFVSPVGLGAAALHREWR